MKAVQFVEFGSPEIPVVNRSWFQKVILWLEN